MRTDGWKHFLSRGQVEISGYYKTRRNVVALRPEAFIEDDQWSNYIMEGDGDSYGIKGYFFNTWKRWTLQLSYAYTRNYRVDASYTYKKEFRTGRLLLFRAGLYNIVGNPPEEEILNFYSVHWHRNCLPYGSISFKF
mgnify:CR=1 FL=1